jgi:flavin reductase
MAAARAARGMTVLTTSFPVRNAAPVQAPGVQADHFKEALARLASGLAIVTCWAEDGPQGILVSSITGLSVDPPRFLFCVRREASAHDALVGAQLCGVSILSADDEAEARTFIDPGLRDVRFTSPRWRLAPSHPPVLESGLSSATCLVDRVIDAGAHSILIVTAQSLGVRHGEPLLSYNRDLRRLQPGPDEGDPRRGDR